MTGYKPFRFVKRGVTFGIFSLCIGWAAAAATYYVDATGGNDANNGTATTRAWKSLAKVGAAALAPGDTVLFKRNETWRGQLNLVRSGTAARPIRLAAYDSGTAPLFNGADIVSAWTAAGNNLYTSAQSTEPDIVVFNGVKGSRAASAAEVDAPGEWYWAANVLTIYSASAPQNMEVASRHFVLTGDNIADVQIQDLSIKYGIDAVCMNETIRVLLDNLTISEGAGMGAIILISYAAGKGEYNTVQNCTVYNISGSAESLQNGNDGSGIILYGEMCKYNVITNCMAHHCGHEGLFIMGGSYNRIAASTVSFSGQSGFRVALETAVGNVLEGNLSYQNGQTTDDRYGIDLIRVGNDNIVRYNRVHDQRDTLNDPTIPGNGGGTKYGTGGIRFDGGDWEGNDYMASTGNQAYYNVIYNETTALLSFNFSNIAFLNNVVYNTSKHGIAFVSASATISTNNIAKNNIVVPAAGSAMVRYRTLQNIIDYNVYFSTGTLQFLWDNIPGNFAYWKTQSQQDAHALVANPLWVNPAAADFHLQNGSPCVDFGVDLGLTQDMDGIAVPQRGGVDVGAFELPTPTIALNLPNGGETYATGQTVPIQWTYTGDPGSVIKIELIQNGVPSVLTLNAALGSAGVGNWNWTIPYAQPAGDYRIRLTSAAYAGCTDESDADFHITAPTISVLAPIGGETWGGGETHLLQWTYTGDPGASVNIELMNGLTPALLAANVSAGSGGTGSWNWTIPPSQTAGTAYRIRVTSVSNSYCSGISPAPFTIVTPRITVTQPNGANIWRGGETHAIQWSYIGLPSDTVQISLLKSGVSTVLAANVPIGNNGTGAWDWTIPPAQPAGTDYRIRINNTSIPVFMDGSDADFTIELPAISVDSPNGGEIWATGENHTLQWNYSGQPGSLVRIELLDGAAATVLADAVALGDMGAGNWEWRIPLTQPGGTNFRLRVSSTDYSWCTDASNLPFTINAAPTDTIALISPDGGEYWTRGETRRIQWFYAGDPGPLVRLELLNGGVPSILANSVSIGSGGTGYWDWTIGSTQNIGSNFQVRVTSLTKPTCTDSSSQPFTLDAASLNVSSPNGGESWYGGDTQTLRWNYTGNPGAQIRIELLKNGVPVTLADNVPVGAGGEGAWNWTIPAEQTPGNDYQFRIVSTTNALYSDTSDAAFTLRPPAISVLTPFGGETWTGGETRTLQWSYVGNPGGGVRIELLNNGVPTVLATDVALGVSGAGSWNWTIPADQTPGNLFQIRVTSLTMPACADSNDTPFSITAPTIAVNAPNGGESYATGAVIPIRWSYTGLPGTTVDVAVLNGASSSVLASGISLGSAGTGSWNWTVPLSYTSGTDYRIRVTCTGPAPCSDTSDAPFSITAPAITVTSPDGGNTFTTGQSYSIQWTYSGNPGTQARIELINGASSSILVSNASIGSAGTGAWTWNIPTTQVTGSAFRIRITSTTNAFCSDMSNAPFSIAPPPPTLTVTAPNGGETWHVGQTRQIQWSFTNDPGATVLIELLQNGVPTTLAANAPAGSAGAGSWDWAIPASQPIGGNYRIRVSSVSTPACTDSSNADFTINQGISDSITVTSPNGEENWLSWESHRISWTYAGSPGAYVKIELLRSGASPTVLVASTSIGSAGSGFWNWNISVLQESRSDYSIRITSTSAPACTDTSDRYFTVSRWPGIRVEYPNGGQQWNAGESQTLRWSYAGNVGSAVKISLVRGSVTTVLANEVPIGADGKGSWTWPIPSDQLAATNYRVRLETNSFLASNDSSDADFAILAPTLTVKTPNGGETWRVGDTIPIQWNYSGYPGPNVQVALLDGASASILATNIPIGENGAGAWNWTVPWSVHTGSDYRIRITSTNLNTCLDASDTPFSLRAPALTVNTPNGAENWICGETHNIEWSFTDDPGATVKIELLNDGVPALLAEGLAIGTGGQGVWPWAIPVQQAPGTRYQVRVTSETYPACFDDSDAMFSLAVLPPRIAEVFVEPGGGGKALIGESLRLVVQMASGTPPFTYRWYKDGNLLDIPNSDTFFVAGAQSNDSGNYQCEVINSAGSDTSITINIRVAAPLVITQQPQGNIYTPGKAHTFTVATEGGFEPLAYEWRKEGSNEILSMEPSLLLSNLRPEDSGEYYVIIIDDDNTVQQSQYATLTVQEAVPASGRIGLLLITLGIAAIAVHRLRNRSAHTGLSAD